MQTCKQLLRLLRRYLRPTATHLGGQLPSRCRRKWGRFTGQCFYLSLLLPLLLSSYLSSIPELRHCQMTATVVGAGTEGVRMTIWRRCCITSWRACSTRKTAFTMLTQSTTSLRNGSLRTAASVGGRRDHFSRTAFIMPQAVAPLSLCSRCVLIALGLFGTLPRLVILFFFRYPSVRDKIILMLI